MASRHGGLEICTFSKLMTNEKPRMTGSHQRRRGRNKRITDQLTNNKT